MALIYRLGFNEADVAMALSANYNDIDAATAWLFENAPRSDFCRESAKSEAQSTGDKDDDVDSTKTSAKSALAKLAERNKSSSHHFQKSHPSFKSLLKDESHLSPAVTRFDVATPLHKGENDRSNTKMIETYNCSKYDLNSCINEHITLQFACSGICCRLIDDSQGKDVPLFEGKLENTILRSEVTKVLPQQNQIYVYMDFRLACNTFNPESSVWEPIIEPWSPTLVVSLQLESCLL